MSDDMQHETSGFPTEREDMATRKAGGLGQDGTIPDDPDGVAAGHTGEASTFEPEEDEQVERDLG